MSALLLPSGRVLIEMDLGFVLLVIAVLTLVIIGCGTAIAIGMLRIGQQEAPSAAIEERGRLTGLLEARDRTIDQQQSQIRRQAEAIGQYKGAARHMRSVS